MGLTAKMRTFPVIPRSVKALEPGDYWAISLDGGRYACGRVLQVVGDELPTSTQSFFGGLHDWSGDCPPCDADVRASSLVEFGMMHVKAIRETGNAVIGNVPLSADEHEIPLLLSSYGGPAARVLKGCQFLRSARREEWGKLPVLGGWGYDFIRELARCRYSAE